MEIGGTAGDAGVEKLPDQVASTGILDGDWCCDVGDVDYRLGR